MDPSLTDSDSETSLIFPKKKQKEHLNTLVNFAQNFTNALNTVTAAAFAASELKKCKDVSAVNKYLKQCAIQPTVPDSEAANKMLISLKQILQDFVETSKPLITHARLASFFISYLDKEPTEIRERASDINKEHTSTNLDTELLPKVRKKIAKYYKAQKAKTDTTQTELSNIVACSNLLNEANPYSLDNLIIVDVLEKINTHKCVKKFLKLYEDNGPAQVFLLAKKFCFLFLAPYL